MKSRLMSMTAMLTTRLMHMVSRMPCKILWLVLRGTNLCPLTANSRSSAKKVSSGVMTWLVATSNESAASNMRAEKKHNILCYVLEGSLVADLCQRKVDLLYCNTCLTCRCTMMKRSKTKTEQRQHTSSSRARPQGMANTVQTGRRHDRYNPKTCD